MENRHQNSLATLITFTTEVQKDSLVVFSSPTDTGVKINQGRNGSRLAPKAIISTLMKLNKHQAQQNIEVIEVTNRNSEETGLIQAQDRSAKKIAKILLTNSNHRYIHLGGGHDHAYPLLKGIQESGRFKNILTINIDAHADTRIDKVHHSGTPFRNFDEVSTLPHHIIQYGLHKFANSPATMSDLKQTKQNIFYFDQLRTTTESFSRLPTDIFKALDFTPNKETAIFFSLDCDAIDASVMKAVSAVNCNGLSLEHIQLLMEKVEDHFPEATLFFGIYEYNPVYDDLSQLGARSISSLIYKTLK
ncbi:MAG: arginase family protein [Flavobacteriaceae bacterium]|nr:arginase family protein [Flavobacteriaceae bacterium]